MKQVLIIPYISIETSVPVENESTVNGTPDMSLETSVPAENERSDYDMPENPSCASYPYIHIPVANDPGKSDTPVIDITESEDEFRHLRKPRRIHTSEKKPKSTQHYQARQDVPYGTNYKSFKEEGPVSSALNFSQAFNRVFLPSQVLKDDGNQLFDFMQSIMLQRYASILKGPKVKFDQFVICILRHSLRLHICVFLFKDVWLLSENLTISDCELFLGCLENLTFKYIPTSGHAVPFQYSPKQDATAIKCTSSAIRRCFKKKQKMTLW